MRSKRFACALSLFTVFACSSSSETPQNPLGPDAGTSTTTKPAPATFGEAPVLEDFESSAPETTKPGNTPIPAGVRCTPISDTEIDIGYSCSVYVSKTQTASEASSFTCGARDVKYDTSNGEPQSITATAATDPKANFALAIPKAAFPTLTDVSLTASCVVQGGGVQVNRPYRLRPAK